MGPGFAFLVCGGYAEVCGGADRYCRLGHSLTRYISDRCTGIEAALPIPEIEN